MRSYMLFMKQFYHVNGFIDKYGFSAELLLMAEWFRPCGCVENSIAIVIGGG